MSYWVQKRLSLSTESNSDVIKILAALAKSKTIVIKGIFQAFLLGRIKSATQRSSIDKLEWVAGIKIEPSPSHFSFQI